MDGGSLGGGVSPSFLAGTSSLGSFAGSGILSDTGGEWSFDNPGSSSFISAGISASTNFGSPVLKTSEPACSFSTIA